MSLAPTLSEILVILGWRAVLPEGALKHDVFDDAANLVGERMEAYQVWRELRRRGLVTRGGYVRRPAATSSGDQGGPSCSCQVFKLAKVTDAGREALGEPKQKV